MEGSIENAPTEKQETSFDVSKWCKKFEASEKLMKRQFKWKYVVAKKRLRAEQNVLHRNSQKMTHTAVNLVYSIGTNFVNSVYFKSPNCNLTAREEVEHDRIENTEVKVNDWLKDNRVKKVVKRCIWDAYLSGFGARFIDHEYDDIDDLNNILEPAQTAPDPETGEEIEIAPAQYGKIVLKNEVTIQRIRPDLVRFPKGFDFDNYQESPWIGFELILPIEEVKENDSWDSDVREGIEGDRYDKLSDGEYDKEKDDSGDDLYAKVSYCFIRGKSEYEPMKLKIFCSKNKIRPLAEIDWNKGSKGYPIKFIYFNPLDDDCSYPNGDCWNFESQLQAVDEWWRKYTIHIQKSNPKFFYDSGAVDTKEVQKMKSTNDLEWVGLKNKQQRDLRQLFAASEAPPVHPNVTQYYDVARQLLGEVGPKTSLSRGSKDEKVDTATEAKFMQIGENIDTDARIDDVRDFIVDIVKDVAGILEDSFVAETPVTHEDDQGNQMTVPVNRDGFTSNINVDVDVESMQAQNKDVFRRQLIDSLQFLIKFEPMMNKESLDPETGEIKSGKTLEPHFWLERIMETLNIRNVEKGIVDLPPMVPGVDGQVPLPPVPESGTIPPSEDEGGIPQEAIEAGLGQRV